MAKGDVAYYTESAERDQHCLNRYVQPSKAAIVTVRINPNVDSSEQSIPLVEADTYVLDIGSYIYTKNLEQFVLDRNAEGKTVIIVLPKPLKSAIFLSLSDDSPLAYEPAFLNFIDRLENGGSVWQLASLKPNMDSHFIFPKQESI